ncbi:hypothetical protein O3P69_004355 [Scylla paramamosain]|uniref:Uncharacterized protein n=1 Tax=Scylla paramamosain TaxID=85552 RepID=A0AAW0UFR5_SCYPA
MQSDSILPPTSPPVAAAQVKLPTFSVDHILASLPEELYPCISERPISKGDTAIEYSDLKTFLLQCFTPSAASPVTQLLQLSKQPLCDQRPSKALFEMKALARLSPAADGSKRKLDLLQALWLLHLSESICAVIPNAEEMDEDELQQMADRLNNAQAAAGCHVNAVPFITSTAPPCRRRLTLQQSTTLQCVPVSLSYNNNTTLGHNHDSSKTVESSSMACAIFTLGLVLMPGTAELVVPSQRTCKSAATYCGSPRWHHYLFLHDPINGVHILVDTRTGRSLLPASQWRKPHLPQLISRLMAPNGTLIQTYSCQHLNVRIGNHTCGRNFVLADVTHPLLGADFLANYLLLINISSARLLDTVSLATTPIAVAPDNLAIQVIDATDDFSHFQDSYPDVLKPMLCLKI